MESPLAKPLLSNSFSKWEKYKTIHGNLNPEIKMYKHHHNKESYDDEINEMFNKKESQENEECKSVTDVSSISSYSQTIIDYINGKGWNDYLSSDLSDVDSIDSFQFQADVHSRLESDSEFKNVLQECESSNRNKYDKNTAQDTIQHKSELFQKSLSELGEELKIYKTENKMLRLQRCQFKEEFKKLKELYATLQKEQDTLLSEKEQLSREKSIFKSQIKEDYRKAYEKLVKAHKQDQQIVHLMQAELEKLKDEFLHRESDWFVTSGRQKSQIRILQIENSKLKQELKKNLPSKGSKQSTISKGKKISDSTKEQITQHTPSVEANCQTHFEFESGKLLEEELKRKNRVITVESIIKKRNLYESLLRDAVKDFSESQLEKKSTKNHDNKSDDNQSVQEVQRADGCVEYHHPNGNIKIIFPGESKTKMIYYNGDIQETDGDGTVKYFYASSRTLHTTMPDGLEIFEFPDGQVEQRSKDGTVTITFPDGSVKIIQYDGSEKWILDDGTVIQTSVDGGKVITFLNGQKEIHTKEYKRQEFPDGTIKIIYPEGIQESRFVNGRISIKDKYGNLMMDTHLHINHN